VSSVVVLSDDVILVVVVVWSIIFVLFVLSCEVCSSVAVVFELCGCSGCRCGGVYGKVDTVLEGKEVFDRDVGIVVTVELVEVGRFDDGKVFLQDNDVLVSDGEELVLDDEELLLDDEELLLDDEELLLDDEELLLDDEELLSVLCSSSS
jgi:hypothetical protein